MKAIVKTALLTAFCGTLSVPAMADYDKPLGLSVRVGLYFTGSATAQAVEGNRWMSGGVEYKLGNLDFGGNGYSASYSISLDYYGKGGWSSAPLLINYIGRQDAFYYEVGAGIAFTKTFTNNQSNGANTDFAYGLTLGYDIVKGQTPAFIEAKFYGSGRPDLNGYGISVGLRF